MTFNILRRTETLLWVWMSVFMLLSLFFYKSRLYIDSSYYLFQIVSNGEFIFEHKRPISVVSQWIPLILVHLQAPMKWIMIGYSFNEWLYWCILFILLLHGYKEKGGALALLLLMTLSNKENWLNPVSELVQGGALLVFTVFYFKHESVKERFHPLKYLLIWAWLALIILSHPLQILTVPISFSILFLHFKINKKIFIRFLLLAIPTLVISVYKYLSLDAYESDSQRLFVAEMGNHTRSELLWMLFCSYGSLFAVISGTLIYVFIKSSAWKAIMCSFLFIGYTAFIINKTGYLIFPESPTFERYLFPLSLMAVLLLGLQSFKDIKIKKIFLCTLVLFEFAMLFYINFPAIFYYYNRMERFMNWASQFPEQKLIHEPWRMYQFPFRSASFTLNTSMLASALINTAHTQQLIDASIPLKSDVEKVGNQSHIYFYSNWWTKELKDMSKTKYFSFKPSPFRYLNNSGKQAHLPDYFFHQIKIEAFPDQTIPFFRNQLNYLPITIHNPHPVPIYSGHEHEKPYLAYHWEGPENVWDGERTLPAADVIGLMPQDMVIKAPSKPGKYTLVIDLMYENKKWCGINSKHLIKVW